MKLMSNHYLSIRYTEHLAEVGIEPSAESVGELSDNALAETINELFNVGPPQNSGFLPRH